MKQGIVIQGPTEYYKELDLYKYKANWCVKNNYELNA